jgi:D-alanyl-D-alanine carboxypeptidase
MQKCTCRLATLAVTALLLLACAQDTTPAQPKVLTEATKAQLEAAADSVFAELKPPGMIALISVDGEGDYLIKRGVSNTVTGQPMSEDYYFRIGSNTKTLVGTAVLILVDEGKIRLDTPIATYLPEYNIPNGDRITVRMLGNMTSGLFEFSSDPAFFGPFLASSGYSYAYTTGELLTASFRNPPNFEPGAKWEYCNTNLVLLGLLLEKVTGKPAKQVILETVIQPMGLTHTYWPDAGSQTEPYTHGYTSALGDTIDATNWNPSWGYTAGILISTFADMKIWAKAVAEGTLLSKQMQAERVKSVTGYYGFCVTIAGNWFGHAGTIFGYNSHVFYNTEKKATYIVLVNTETGHPVEKFSKAFMGILDK